MRPCANFHENRNQREKTVWGLGDTPQVPCQSGQLQSRYQAFSFIRPIMLKMLFNIKIEQMTICNCNMAITFFFQALLNSQRTFVPGDHVGVPGTSEKISFYKTYYNYFGNEARADQEFRTPAYPSLEILWKLRISSLTVFSYVALNRAVNMAELRRIRRQFITYTKMHPVEDTKKIANMFVQYLNSSLQ